MKASTKLLFALSATVLLVGCGVKQEEHQRVVEELQQTKSALAERESSIAEKEAALAKVKAEQSAAAAKNDELQKRVALLEKQDSFVFSQIGKTVDSGDNQSALRAYQSFVRDYPRSPFVAEANNRISQLQEAVRRAEEERAAREARERQERAEREARAQEEQEKRALAEKLRSGNLTVYEWWPILRGQTMAEVKELLGVPGYSGDDDREWVYYNKAVAPNSGKKEWLNIYFRGGRVRGVSSESMKSVLQD